MPGDKRVGRSNTSSGVARGSRLRWGVSDLVILSVPLTEEAPHEELDLLAGRVSPTERAVVTLAGAGHSNAEIARKRGTSSSTIKKQLESAYRKLGIRSRAELAVLLSRRGRQRL